jgi:hypothetical protein
MRTLKKNKQKMYYANQDRIVPIYETYIDDDGNEYQLDTGETKLVYGEPVEFSANISNKLNEVKWAEYGIDESTNYAQIVVSKGSVPLKVGSIIWKKSEIGYENTEENIVDENTSDYLVKGVADEGLTEDWYLLKKRVK